MVNAGGSAVEELAVLSVAYGLDNAYEAREHKKIAHQMGISEAKLDALESGDVPLEVFDRTERAVVMYAASLATSDDPSDSVLEELRKALRPDQMVDLVLVVGWYRLVDTVIRGLEVPPEK